MEKNVFKKAVSKFKPKEQACCSVEIEENSIDNKQENNNSNKSEQSNKNTGEQSSKGCC